MGASPELELRRRGSPFQFRHPGAHPRHFPFLDLPSPTMQMFTLEIHERDLFECVYVYILEKRVCSFHQIPKESCDVGKTENPCKWRTQQRVVGK